LELFRYFEKFNDYLWQAVLEKGIKEGMIRSDVSKDIFPYIVTIIVEGIFQLNRFPGIKAKGDELFKEAMKMIYEGILTSEGKASFTSRWK